MQIMSGSVIINKYELTVNKTHHMYITCHFYLLEILIIV